MRRIILFCGFVAGSVIASADPALIAGVPGDATFSTPTGPSVSFGPLINFDELTPNTTLNPSQYAAQGITSISSPDGLSVIPFSTQSFPNEIFDASPDGSANITILLNRPTNEIGLGIADSDPVTISLQPLGAGGTDLGSAFQVGIPTDTINPGNGYYAVSDPNFGIQGLQILETSGDPSFSGLAIDDLQVSPAPEPATLTFAAGVLALGIGAWRRRA